MKWIGKTALAILVSAVLGLVTPSPAAAQQQEDFDQYRFRLDTFWFYSKPSGRIQGTVDVDSTSIDLQKDLGFNTYSTFSGKLEWKFTRKNHLYVAVIPFYTNHQTTLTRTITFQGQTFDVGLATRSDLRALLVTAGYQYDIIRRKRGHLGIAVQADLFNTSAKISAAAQIVNGEQQAAVSASGSLLAPIPVVGPEFRIYAFNSSHFFIEGNLYGMYFLAMATLCLRPTQSVLASTGTSASTRATSWDRAWWCRKARATIGLACA